jgi:hypothetical protein
MKQTAVKWLVQEINKLTGLTIAMDEPCVVQAKEMEKEQIIEAWIATDNELQRIAAGQYYKETFKSE